MDIRLHRLGGNDRGHRGQGGLWTDSRYFLQAASQLEGSGIELYKLALPETPSITEFLLHELHAGQAVGLDGQTYSAAEASAWQIN